MKNQPLTIVVLSLLVIWLYKFVVPRYFFQDDFYSLIKSQAHSISEFFQFFIPGKEIYYRPISMRVYFLVVQWLFGPNPLVFHMISLVLHIINSNLVGKITNKVFNNPKIALCAAILYATSSIHFLSLVWIAEVGLLAGITLLLLSVNFYLIHYKGFSHKDQVTLTLIFIFGLLTHEYMLTLPFIMVLIDIYTKTRNLKKYIPFLVIAILYIALRIIAFPVSISGNYRLTLGKPTILATFWYGLWSLNIPENIQDNLEPGMKLNQSFLNKFPLLSLTILATLVAVMIFVFAIPLLCWFKKNHGQKITFLRKILFAPAWIIVTLAIPLLAPLHLYSLYASLALIGVIWIIIALTDFAYSSSDLVLGIITTAWILTSWQSIHFMEKIHWSIQEANRTANVKKIATNLYPSIPTYSTIIIPKDYQIKEALYGNDGLRVIYQDNTLTTHYGSVDDIMPIVCTIESSQSSCLHDHKIYVIPSQQL